MKFVDLLSLVTILALLESSVCSEQPYQKVIHNTDPEARCLDGSSPALYIHKGGDSSNILIFFQGGGYCEGTNIGEVIQSCYQRSKGQHGSSKYYPDQFIGPGGYLSTDPALSRFATWTKVIILYCDGTFHQGSNRAPIQYKDSLLYLRGADNTKSHLKYLVNNHGLADAKKVLFTGASSGGIATYIWSNYVRTLVKNPAAVYSVADSGVFMNLTSTTTGKYVIDTHVRNLYKVSNVDVSTPFEVCNKKFAGEQYKCLFFEFAFTSLQGRFMVINSQYDEVATEVVLDIHCLSKGVSGDSLAKCNSSQISSMEAYRKQYLSLINKFMLFSKNSVWTIACSTHSYACYENMYNVPQQKIPQTSGQTVKDAIDSFVFDDKRVEAIDKETWPGNAPCAY